MRTVGTAAAVGLATGIVTGVVGHFLVKLLIEPLGILEGPPAGVCSSPFLHFSLRFAGSSASLRRFCGFAEKQFDFNPARQILATKIRELAEGGYIERAEPVVFIGECGTGKTHLAT